MANFKSKDILTVSATVIAGLLILLTLQSLSTNAVLTKITSIQGELDTKNIEYGANIETQISLKSDLANTNNTEERNHIQTQIDDLKSQSYQLKAETLGLENQNSQWLSLSNQHHIAQNIQILRLVVLIMVLPFAIAIIVEAKASLKSGNSENEFATDDGKKCLIIGGVVVVIGLIVIFSSAWF